MPSIPPAVESLGDETRVVARPDGRLGRHISEAASGHDVLHKTRHLDHLSYRDDVDQVLDPAKGCGVAGVEAGTVSVRCRCDQQIHHPRARLAAGAGNCGRAGWALLRDLGGVELSLRVLSRRGISRRRPSPLQRRDH